MTIGIGRRKQEQSKKRPYTGELGGFAMADAMRNGRYSLLNASIQDDKVDLPRRKSGKLPSKPELGGFAAAQHFGRRLPSVSDTHESSHEPEFD